MKKLRPVILSILLVILLFLVNRGALQLRAFSASEAQLKLDQIDLIQKNKAPSPSILVQEKLHTVKQARSISTTDLQQKSKKVEFSEKEVFCLLERSSTKVTLGGDVKIVSGKYGVYPDGLGIYAWVYSSQCPKDLYSVVRINKAGIIETEIDCHKTSLEELTKETGLQWNVDEHIAEFGAYNFAISGPGQFLVYCPKEGFFLTRRGHFEFDNGMLRDIHGCFLWQNGDQINPKGGPVTLETPNDRLTTKGCFERSGQCVAMMDLGDPIVQSFSYVNSALFAVDLKGNLQTATRSYVFSNALENLDDEERGPTGIQKWESIPYLEQPVVCP